ncbi:MAG TPA: AbrB/MazE/SpoVT family DNA-binding domain-containing protein [Terriglobales bacterium]|jgi:antitoxin MazE|nr:AbrB/MazE/SpoVT family DNA-binding domain-containing protein [Terriglobales bacterium]
MKAELIKIGNSRGVRIPKALIEQCGLGTEVELRVEKDRLVISPQRRPREDWAAKFKAAAQHDELLMPVGPNEFDLEEWQW